MDHLDSPLLSTQIQSHYSVGKEVEEYLSLNVKLLWFNSSGPVWFHITSNPRPFHKHRGWKRTNVRNVSRMVRNFESVRMDSLERSTTKLVLSIPADPPLHILTHCHENAPFYFLPLRSPILWYMGPIFPELGSYGPGIIANSSVGFVAECSIRNLYSGAFPYPVP